MRCLIYSYNINNLFKSSCSIYQLTVNFNTYHLNTALALQRGEKVKPNKLELYPVVLYASLNDTFKIHCFRQCFSAIAELLVHFVGLFISQECLHLNLEL